MVDVLNEAIAEFTALVERVRPFLDLPCVCVPEDDPSDGMTEESIARCTRCHAQSVFDEALEMATDTVKYIEGMANRHPSQPVTVQKRKRSNVVRSQPMGKQPQPEATWKY